MRTQCRLKILVTLITKIVITSLGFIVNNRAVALDDIHHLLSLMNM